MLIQTRMILVQNSNMCNYCLEMLLNKKQSEFVRQHLHVKRCWTKLPQQRINRTVSTQRRTRVCWLVLEPSIGAVGLSTLRNMLENHPLNCVILPIFLLLISTGGYQDSARVPEIPIRNCAGSSNNLVPRVTKVSAIDVTSKVFFERLYWFQDWPYLSSESTVCVLPHPHCSGDNYFSMSVQFFWDMAPHFLSAHDSPSNLAKSRYPRLGQITWWIVLTTKNWGATWGNICTEIEK